MYSRVANIPREYASGGRGRPMFLVEYAYSRGNATGNLQDYWTFFENQPYMLGGFIWDWQDKGIRRTDANGKQYFAYGGDFGDKPNDETQVMNGIVTSDRSPTPALAEVKKVYQEIKITAVDLAAGKVNIKNRYVFRDLSFVKGSWKIEENGVEIASGALPTLDIAPGADREIALPLKQPQLRPGAEYFLTVKFDLAAATAWAARRPSHGFRAIPSALVRPGGSRGRHHANLNRHRIRRGRGRHQWAIHRARGQGFRQSGVLRPGGQGNAHRPRRPQLLAQRSRQRPRIPHGQPHGGMVHGRGHAQTARSQGRKPHAPGHESRLHLPTLHRGFHPKDRVHVPGGRRGRNRKHAPRRCRAGRHSACRPAIPHSR